ncbi:hypothetical protein Tco_0366255 [Tanacetum coccineum]
MTSSSMITMRFPSFTFLTQTQTTIKLSQTSSLNVVLGRHSQEHPTKTKSIFLNFGALLKLLRTPKNTIGANHLSHSTEYADVPSLETIRAWFSTIGYSGEIRAKGTLKKSCLPPRLNKKTKEKVVPYPRFLSLLLEHKMEGYGNDNVTLNPTQVFSVHNWALKKNQAEGPPFTDHMLGICKAKEPVAFKAPRTSLKFEKKVTQGTKPGAKSGRRKKQIPFTYNHPQSKIETTKSVSSSKGDTGSKTGHLVKDTQSSSAIDFNPIQPSASTPVVAELHKEDQQATCDPTSLGVTTSTIINSKSASGHNALADFTTEVDLGKSAPNESISKQRDKTKLVGDGLKTAHTEIGTNLETSKAKNENVDMDLDSTKDDEPIIVQDDSDEEVHAEKSQNSKLKKEKTKAKDEVALLSAQPSYLNWKLPAEFLVVPTQVQSVQAKIKTLDDFPSLLNKVTEALNKCAQVIESASKKNKDTGVPSAGQAGSHPAEGEKNTQQVTIS